MTAIYNPTLCAALVAEMRDDDAKATPGPWRFDGVDINQLTDAGKGYPLDVYPDSAVVVDGKCDDCGLVGIRLEVDAEAIVRTRNRLATVAEQLEAAGAEVMALCATAKVSPSDTETLWGEICKHREQCPSVIAERDALRADNDGTRAVFEAAKSWRDQYEEVMRVNGVVVAHPMPAALLRAVRKYRQVTGRWPANLVLSHHAGCLEDGTELDEYTVSLGVDAALAERKPDGDK